MRLAPAAAMGLAGAPTGALFRLLLVRWGKLGWFGAFALFIVGGGWAELGDAQPLPDGVGIGAAMVWLVAPVLALLVGFLPVSLARGFSESPFTRALPGLGRGLLGGTLLVGGCVGVGLAGAALASGIGGAGTVALTTLALVHLLIATLSTGIGDRTTRPANRFLLSPGRSWLLVLVGHALLWEFLPDLPARIGMQFPVFVTLASLLCLTLLLLGLVWTRPARPSDWARPGGAWAMDPITVWELFRRDPRPRSGLAGRLAMGEPPSARAWRERRIRSAMEAGHYERAHMDLNSPGLLAEWLVLPVLLMGIAWYTGALSFFLVGAVVACVFPGLGPVGALRYPLSRRDRARLVWAAHMVQGGAGVALAGSFAVAIHILSPSINFQLSGGTGPILALGLILAWLPVGMVIDTLQQPYRLGIDSPRPPASLRILFPGVPILAGVVASAVGFGRAGLSGPAEILPALTLLAVALHGAGWLFLRWHFGRCNLGPSDV